jgi:iron-sulfur cluster assembly accessory protein
MIHLTENAVAEIKRLCAAKDHVGPARLTTRSGGCAGTKYRLVVKAERNADDTAFELDGLTLLCSPADLAVLSGMTVDFSSDLVGGGFRYENPNAGAVCGCGDSFSPLVSLGELAPGN